jgi:hypothetical protein
VKEEDDDNDDDGADVDSDIAEDKEVDDKVTGTRRRGILKKMKRRRTKLTGLL